MTAADFLILARMETREHKLSDWRVEIVESFEDERIAECDTMEKTLRFLDKRAFACYSTALWLIRHEMAHAKDFLARGFTRHDSVWKKWCRQLKCPATTKVHC